MGRGLGYKNLGLQAYGREYDLLYPGSDHELPSVPVTFLIALTKILYEIKDSELEYSLAWHRRCGAKYEKTVTLLFKVEAESQEPIADFPLLSLFKLTHGMVTPQGESVSSGKPHWKHRHAQHYASR